MIYAYTPLENKNLKECIQTIHSAYLHKKEILELNFNIKKDIKLYSIRLTNLQFRIIII